METSFRSYKQQIQRMQNVKQTGVQMYTFLEAKDIIQKELNERFKNLEVALDISKAKNKAEFREQFKQYIDHITSVVFKKNIRVRGYEDEIDAFIREMAHEFGGYSVLADAMEDEEVTDIFIVSWDLIIVERNNENEVYHRKFYDSKHLENTIRRFLRVNDKEINDGDKKIIHFELYGDRGCAIAPSISSKGYSLTLRKHAEEHITLDDIIKANVLTKEIADLLGQLIIGESNIIYGGLTGSGKTTTIRALLDENLSSVNKRALVCEDTQELFLNYHHTVDLVSTTDVTLYDLILTALRLKPKYIIVGEVRGSEAVAAVEGMETGHSTIFTMHGGNSWNIINRLITKYLMGMPSLTVPIIERIVGCSLDFIGIQDNIPKIGRRLSTLDEISYDFKSNQIIIRPIFVFDIIEKKFKNVNKISREKAVNLLRRGVQWEDIEHWVEPEQQAS